MSRRGAPGAGGRRELGARGRGQGAGGARGRGPGVGGARGHPGAGGFGAEPRGSGGLARGVARLIGGTVDDLEIVYAFHWTGPDASGYHFDALLPAETAPTEPLKQTQASALSVSLFEDDDGASEAFCDKTCLCFFSFLVRTKHKHNINT